MMRLLTIPISHYCEKARWALQRVAAPFVEEAHLQGLHYLPVWRAGGRATVPVLIHDGGTLFDSTDILHFIDEHTVPEARLYPADDKPRQEVAALEERFDEELGPSGRLWMYHGLLDRPELAVKYGTTGTPAWQQRLLPLVFPGLRRLLCWRLSINQQSALAATARFWYVLDQVADRLSDGRPYLVGESFTAADLTFAALCAPLLMTPGYGVPLPAVEELPPAAAAMVTSCRQHPAGRFALRLYEQHRWHTVPGASMLPWPPLIKRSGRFILMPPPADSWGSFRAAPGPAGKVRAGIHPGIGADPAPGGAPASGLSMV